MKQAANYHGTCYHSKFEVSNIYIILSIVLESDKKIYFNSVQLQRTHFKFKFLWDPVNVITRVETV